MPNFWSAELWLLLLAIVSNHRLLLLLLGWRRRSVHWSRRHHLVTVHGRRGSICELLLLSSGRITCGCRRRPAGIAAIDVRRVLHLLVLLLELVRVTILLLLLVGQHGLLLLLLSSVPDEVLHSGALVVSHDEL